MNRGARKTAKALRDRGLSVNKGAALLDTDPGTFSKILREEDGRKPGRTLAGRIFAKLGVPVSYWDIPVEVSDTEQPQKPAAE